MLSVSVSHNTENAFFYTAKIIFDVTPGRAS